MTPLRRSRHRRPPLMSSLSSSTAAGVENRHVGSAFASAANSIPPPPLPLPPPMGLGRDGGMLGTPPLGIHATPCSSQLFSSGALRLPCAALHCAFACMCVAVASVSCKFLLFFYLTLHLSFSFLSSLHVSLHLSSHHSLAQFFSLIASPQLLLFLLLYMQILIYV